MFYRKVLLRPFQREVLRLQYKPPGADRTHKLKIRLAVLSALIPGGQVQVYPFGASWQVAPFSQGKDRQSPELPLLSSQLGPEKP